MGFDAWLNEQFEMPPTLTTPLMNERAANGETITQNQFFETWWNRSTPAAREASRSVYVPSTFVRKNRVGSTTARLLCDSAAKLTTTSIRSSRSVDAARSR